MELISLEQVQHNVDKHSCYVKITQRKLVARRKCSKIYFYQNMVTLLITHTLGMSLCETYKLSIVKITFNWARCSLRKNTRAPVVLDCTHFRWVKSVCSLPIKNALNLCTFVVADSRFPRGGANPKAGGSYFAEIISKTTWKWKKLGWGARPKFYYVEPHWFYQLIISVYLMIIWYFQINDLLL